MLGANSYVVEVTGEKLVGGTFLPPPPSWIGLMCDEPVQILLFSVLLEWTKKNKKNWSWTVSRRCIFKGLLLRVSFCFLDKTKWKCKKRYDAQAGCCIPLWGNI